MPLGLEIDSRAPLGPPAWIGYKEAAERLGVSINAIRTMIAKGMLSETRLPIGRPRHQSLRG